MPLSQDPFFQLLRKKKIVREMLIKPGETFTLEKVISLALKQDIGPDPSFSAFEKDMGENDKISKITKIGGIQRHKKQIDENLQNIQRYYSKATFPNQDKLRELISFSNFA